MSEILFYLCKDLEKPKVLLLWTTAISAVNIGGTTIHSGIWIKSASKLLGLNNRSKAASRNNLLQLKFLIVDELFVVSKDLWTNSDSSLREVFMILKKNICRYFSYDHGWLSPSVSSHKDKNSMKNLLGFKW